MRWIAITSLALLAACGRIAPAPTAAAAPAPDPVAPIALDISQPITAIGTEPFWALKIEGKQFTLSRPSEPDVTAEAPGAQMSPGQVAWTATTASGEPMAVKLYVSDCSDGMSDRRYPMSAELQLAGRTLHGCAVRTADRPSQPG